MTIVQECVQGNFALKILAYRSPDIVPNVLYLKIAKIE